MNKLFFIIFGFIFSVSASASVLDSSLILAHDVDKSANLKLEIAGNLLTQLKKGGNLVGFQIINEEGVSIYGAETFYQMNFMFFDSNRNSYLANVNLFIEEKLDNDGIVSFFTGLKKSKIVFFGYASGSPEKTGEFALEPLCESTNVLNLSGANKCEISADQVTNLAPESGSCEDLPQVTESWTEKACSIDSIKASIEKSYSCKFACEQ